MARFHSMCLVFLPFFMMSVQTAPRHTRSNEKNNPSIVFIDEGNDRNFKSLNDSPKIPLLENNKPPQAISLSKKNSINKFPFLDDMRQNWGILVKETLEEDDEESYIRPINIPKPTTERSIKSVTETASRAKRLSAPSSSVVSGNSKFTITSKVKETKLKPTSCDIALVVCCMENLNVENCFSANGCFRKNVPSNICQKSDINETLKKLKDYYH